MTVTEEWARIVTWCAENAPATAKGFRAGADDAEIDAVEAASGVTWPSELREFFDVQNGELGFDPETNKFLGGLLPMKFLLPLDQIVDLKNMMVEVWEGLAEDPDIVPPGQMAEFNGQEAGTEAGMFLPSFVPFASLDDYHYFVDTRPGPQHGCVTEYAHDSVDSQGPEWDSISTMLAAVATTLERGEKFGHWSAKVTDGALEWEI